MYELTDWLVSQRLSPEFHHECLKASEILEQFGRGDALLEMELFITSQEGMGEEALLETILARINHALRATIQDFGIMVNEAITLAQCNELLEALVYLEESEAKETILDFCQSDLSNEEKLAECLSIASAVSAESYLTYFDQVDDSLIQRIIEKSHPEATDDLTEDIQALVLQRERISKVKQALKVIDDRHLKAVTAIQSGAKLGLSFKTYLDLLLGDIAEEQAAFLAPNLYLLALISAEGLNDPIKTIQQYLEEIEPDTVEATKLMTELRKLSMDVTAG